MSGEGTAEQTEPARVEMLPGGVRAAVEAILMVADAPVGEYELAEALLVPVAAVERALDELAREYDGFGGSHTVSGDQGTYTGTSSATASEDADHPGGLGAGPGEPRGMELRRVAGGWRVYSRAEFAPWVQRFVLEGQTARLSQAALETLAVIAYRQPVSRARISSIRGVNVDGVVRTLTTRGLIAAEQQTGESGALLYRTTPMFLEKIGLETLEELPKISPYLPGAEDVGDYEDRL